MASAVRPVAGKRKVTHPLLAAFTPGTAEYEYIEEVIRINENTACNFPDGQPVRFSPLLSLSVIRSRLAVRYENNISAEYDRADIRRAALVRFRDNITRFRILRKRPGPQRRGNTICATLSTAFSSIYSVYPFLFDNKSI